MAQEIINVGAAPDDGTGDPLRTALQKTNNNFTELYSTPPATGDVAGPASAVDNAVARFDTTTGKKLQGSTFELQDNGTFQIKSGANVVVEYTTTGTSSSGGLVIRAMPPHGQQLSITPRSDINGALVLNSGAGFNFDSAISIGNGSATANTVTLSNQTSGNTRALKVSTGLFNLPVITAPTTPTNGDIWMQSDGLYVRVNGVTQKVTAV